MALKATANNDSSSNISENLDRKFLVTRRKLMDNIRDIRYYLTSHLPKLVNRLLGFTNASEELDSTVDDFLENLEERFNYMEYLDAISSNDEQIRTMFNLSKAIQKRLQKLNDPKDCNATRYLGCAINLNCGFGCQMHHITYCLIAAYASGRVLIMDSNC
ncbi:hypothetical protein HELRODRAFT_170714 [Helobdella robusta]|uniref:GT23 domain-containing protein n=1 Tax=Helobdella robusta TaxID=6412 RepID=T1F3C4_HELRO|nr:hypothetical protein HELRODRAFT_170714 [Helobdella robusta]ESO07378.1 hypothetical protein HELRODRAFT_170714 [Helobdella robusta]